MWPASHWRKPRKEATLCGFVPPRYNCIGMDRPTLRAQPLRTVPTPAGQAKNLAQHRVRQEGSRLPGFGGAYLVGSVTTFADGVALPGTSDVDIAVVSNCAPSPRLGKFVYRHLLLDVSFVAWKQVRSHETVLGHSQMAAGFRAWNILADPKDHSARIQQEGAIALCRSLLGATTSSARQ